MSCTSTFISTESGGENECNLSRTKQMSTPDGSRQCQLYLGIISVSVNDAYLMPIKSMTFQNENQVNIYIFIFALVNENMG
jgi:hypothetical protein